jgi:putative hydrolase of the HAD superfamily
MLRYILFDLDDTLYSSRHSLEKAMRERLFDYVAAYLGVSREEAIRQRREHISPYGTTLEWLLAEKGFSPGDVEDYFAKIHPENEAEGLLPDPELRAFLQTLPVPLAILTNSPREHADRILDKLGIGDLFTHIFDIRSNDLRGKPRAEAFYRALAVLGTSPETTLFLDDAPRYVEGYLALSGRGILVDEEDRYPWYAHERIRNVRELRLG